MPDRSTKLTPPGNPGDRRPPSSMASLVLPVPPAPVMVTMRTLSRLIISVSAAEVLASPNEG